MSYSKTTHNIQKKKIVSHVHTRKDHGVTGYHLELNGIPTAPCDLGLSHKNLTKLYFGLYQAVGCSYLEMLLNQLRYAKFLNVSYKHENISEINKLKARLEHLLPLLYVKASHKGFNLFEDTTGEIFIIENDKRLIFKSELAFKQYITKNMKVLLD